MDQELNNLPGCLHRDYLEVLLKIHVDFVTLVSDSDSLMLKKCDYSRVMDEM